MAGALQMRRPAAASDGRTLRTLLLGWDAPLYYHCPVCILSRIAYLSVQAPSQL